MNQSNDKTSELHSYEDKFDSSSITEGAITLATSINEHEFQLVYQAREESVGGTNLRMAKNIIDFAKSYRCSHVLIIDGSCWISPDKGISFLAQIEGNEKLDKYDYVVVPLDHAVYIAKINDGIVVEERVRPPDRAITYLEKQQNKEIAVLAGGHAYEELASHKFVINCDLSIFIHESQAAKYRFLSINRALIKHKLFHQRLFIPLIIVLAPVLIATFLFSPLYNVIIEKKQMKTTGSFLDLQIKAPASTAPVIEAPIKTQIALNNSTSQFLTSIVPWVSGKTIDFLRTCRLKTVELSPQRLKFLGERMSNIKKNQLGCGNSRLDNIARKNKLKITSEKNNWQIEIQLKPQPAQTTERQDYLSIIERLELLTQLIGWRLHIVSTIKDGNKQQLRVLFQGKSLNSEIVKILSEGLSNYASIFNKGSLQYNPNNLDLLDAQLEIDIHTQTGDTL